jgi:DNA-binding transcriptional MerR regulator
VPTLRKYGECGLLRVDAVSGRTNLFDEPTVVSRFHEINELKRKGYSLALIREKLCESAGGTVSAHLDLGLDGSSFSRGHHILLVVRDLPEFYNFARHFVGNGLRAKQAVVLVIHPDRREQFSALLARDGFDVEAKQQTRQLTYLWYDDLKNFDAAGQVRSFHRVVENVIAAGWQDVRGLGEPEADIHRVDPAALHEYERRVDALVEKVPGIVVCTWMAPLGSANVLLDLQRNHKEVKFGDQVYSRS